MDSPNQSIYVTIMFYPQPALLASRVFAVSMLVLMVLSMVGNGLVILANTTSCFRKTPPDRFVVNMKLLPS